MFSTVYPQGFPKKDMAEGSKGAKQIKPWEIRRSVYMQKISGVKPQAHSIPSARSFRYSGYYRTQEETDIYGAR